MIDEQVKLHDRFSAEIKVSFGARKKLKLNDFDFDIWLFVPNSLDVNRFNYSKQDFYRDLRSNIRLIIPVYLLRNIVWAQNSLIVYLEKAFRKITSQPSSPQQRRNYPDRGGINTLSELNLPFGIGYQGIKQQLYRIC